MLPDGTERRRTYLEADAGLRAFYQATKPSSTKPSGTVVRLLDITSTPKVVKEGTKA